MENKNLEQVQEVQEIETVDEVQQENQEVIEKDQLVESIDSFEEEKEKLINEIDTLKKELQLLNEKILQDNLTKSLKKEGLDDFVGLFELQTNEERVVFLKNAVNQILVKNSYQPKEVAKQEAYTQAIEEGNVEKALSFKFANLFKRGN